MMMLLNTMPCAAEPEVTGRTCRQIEDIRAGANRGPIVDLEFLKMMHAVYARLESLGKLPSGWAGPGTGPISRETRERVALVYGQLGRSSMGTPNVVPGADGSVQLEWRTREYELAIAVNGVVDVFLDQHQSEPFEMLDLASDAKTLAAAARTIAARLK